MTVLLFDIDGTLAATGGIDGPCFAAAFKKVFRGMDAPNTDWSLYEHVTDTGIVQEILLRERFYLPKAFDLVRFEEVYLQKLTEAFDAEPASIAEIPGAKAMLESLAADGEFKIALATGGMRKTALYKLKCVGIDGEALPAAFAGDSIDRTQIARLAVERAGGGEPVVYIGDGIWDVKTAAQLGAGFVGISHESSEARLREAGARTIVPDYSDLAIFHDAIRVASVAHG